MQRHKFVSYGLLNPLRIAMLVIPALCAQASTPVIDSATLNSTQTQISVAGQNFLTGLSAPVVTLDGTVLALVTFSNSLIVANMPINLQYGNYSLSVTNGSSETGYLTVAVGLVGPPGPRGPAGTQG